MDHILIQSEGSKLPDPKNGIVIVALGNGGRVAFRGGHGPTLSEKLFGKYKLYTEVDISEKSFSDTLRLPSKSSSMFFEATVHVHYRVTDPVCLVDRATRDGHEAIWSKLLAFLQKSTRSVDGAEVAKAENHAQEEADNFKQQLNAERIGINISSITVSVNLDENTKQLLSDVEQQTMREDQIRARHELERIERDNKAKILSGGARDILAEHLRNDPNFLEEVLNKMTTFEQERHEKEIVLLQKMLNDGTIEAHEIPDTVKEEFINKVLNGANTGGVLPNGQNAHASSQSIEDKSST